MISGERRARSLTAQAASGSERPPSGGLFVCPTVCAALPPRGSAVHARSDAEHLPLSQVGFNGRALKGF
jgi:hypothetical protein